MMGTIVLKIISAVFELISANFSGSHILPGVSFAAMYIFVSFLGNYYSVYMPTLCKTCV